MVEWLLNGKTFTEKSSDDLDLIIQVNCLASQILFLSIENMLHFWYDLSFRLVHQLFLHILNLVHKTIQLHFYHCILIFFAILTLKCPVVLILSISMKPIDDICQNKTNLIKVFFLLLIENDIPFQLLVIVFLYFETFFGWWPEVRYQEL